MQRQHLHRLLRGAAYLSERQLRERMVAASLVRWSDGPSIEKEGGPQQPDSGCVAANWVQVDEALLLRNSNARGEVSKEVAGWGRVWMALYDCEGPLERPAVVIKIALRQQEAATPGEDLLPAAPTQQQPQSVQTFPRTSSALALAQTALRPLQHQPLLRPHSPGDPSPQKLLPLHRQFRPQVPLTGIVVKTDNVPADHLLCCDWRQHEGAGDAAWVLAVGWSQFDTAAWWFAQAAAYGGRCKHLWAY